jgi:hypothetical protein
VHIPVHEYVCDQYDSPPLSLSRSLFVNVVDAFERQNVGERPGRDSLESEARSLDCLAWVPSVDLASPTVLSLAGLGKECAWNSEAAMF